MLHMVKLRLKILRVEREMSQMKLVELTGIRRPTVSAMENNAVKTISIAHIDKLCEVLECTPADLFSYKKQ